MDGDADEQRREFQEAYERRTETYRCRPPAPAPAYCTLKDRDAQFFGCQSTGAAIESAAISASPLV